MQDKICAMYICIEYSYYIINNIQRKINKKKKIFLEFDEELVAYSHKFRKSCLWRT